MSPQQHHLWGGSPAVCWATHVPSPRPGLPGQSPAPARTVGLLSPSGPQPGASRSWARTCHFACLWGADLQEAVWSRSPRTLLKHRPHHPHPGVALTPGRPHHPHDGRRLTRLKELSSHSNSAQERRKEPPSRTKLGPPPGAHPPHFSQRRGLLCVPPARAQPASSALCVRREAGALSDLLWEPPLGHQ